ncbi:hypothetical protein [Mucilaginibacter sp. PAMB04168]|uniref:hypothetical protein n=1 Tax=Mucilaginibacter sp. PAMB04168 TaxID=3138567 RepID=UPI0031F5F209
MKKLLLLLLVAACLVACKKNLTSFETENAAESKRFKTMDLSGSSFTTNNWKGVTWGGPWNKWGADTTGTGLPDIGPYNLDGINSDVDDMHDAGIHWVRMSFKVGQDMERDIDPKVNAAVSAGLNILMRYMKGEPFRSYGTEAQESANETFLKNVVARYKSKIKYWEIHNEPNLTNQWDLGDRVGENSTDPNTPYNLGVHKYNSHLKRSYNAIKSVDPSATVIMGGLSHWTNHYLNFYARMTADSAYAYTDGINIHPYSTNATGVMNVIRATKNAASTWGASHKSVWVTEIGYQTSWTTLTSYVSSEATKASYLTETMDSLAANLSPMRPIFWYNIHEPSSATGFGLEQKTLSSGTVSATKLAAHTSYKAMSDGATAITLVSEDFEFGNSPNPPDFWQITNASSTASEVRYTGSNLVLRLSDNNSAGTTKARKTFTTSSGIITCEFKFNEADVNKYTRYRLMYGGNDLIVLGTVYNGTTNQLNYINTSGAKTGLQNISANTWYTVKVVASTATDQADIYVNGVLKSSGVAFNNVTTNINAFEVETGNSYTGAVAMVDDIYIRK